MKLAEMTVTQFADVLASDAPAPGGGSTAALAGALGAALTAMVCRLTEGRKKYEQFQDHVLQVKEKATRLQEKFIEVMDRDTEAFMQLYSDRSSSLWMRLCPTWTRKVKRLSQT